MKLSDIPTPETDRLAFSHPNVATLESANDQYDEMFEHARSLERINHAVRAVATMEAYAVCAEICQEESTDNGTAQKIEARIRALKERK